MQNLRDKLLKAGLVDKKQKQQVDVQDRRDKKQRGAAELLAEEEAKRRAFEEKQLAEAEQQRQADLARAEKQLAHEREHRVRSICDRWAVRQSKPGLRRFYFAQRVGRIGHLALSEVLCEQLRIGALAVVERVPVDEQQAPVTVSTGQGAGAGRGVSLVAALRGGGRASKPAAGFSTDTHVLLPADVAERVLEIDETAVRFWARRAQPIGILPEPPGTETEAAAPGAPVAPPVQV